LLESLFLENFASLRIEGEVAFQFGQMIWD